MGTSAQQAPEAAGHQEVEVKLRVVLPEALLRLLRKMGAKPVNPLGGRGAKTARIHEENTLFDTPDGGLAKHGQMLRIRVESLGNASKPVRAGARRCVLTFKGPALPPGAGGGGYKIREELEAELPDPAALRPILEALGLRAYFRYEKFRTTYELPRSQRWAAGLHIQVDETPIGTYAELEGPPAAIDRAAELLGYRRSDYITKTYLGLYVEDRRRRGLPPATDMTFADAPPPASKEKK